MASTISMNVDAVNEITNDMTAVIGRIAEEVNNLKNDRNRLTDLSDGNWQGGHSEELTGYFDGDFTAALTKMDEAYGELVQYITTSRQDLLIADGQS